MDVSPLSLSPTTTVSPAVLSKKFEAEEWEDWMKWDGAQETLSTNSSHSRSPSIPGGTADSASPSEPESLPNRQIPQVYILPELMPPPDKKRKVLDEEPLGGRKQRGKKVSHNVIEKRYRFNLNDKIAKLRDSVPALRQATTVGKRISSKPNSDSEGSDDDGKSSGLKCNKATVLTKATEYIQQLERQNQRLMADNSILRNRLRTADRPRAVYPVAGSAAPNSPTADSTSGLSENAIRPEEPQSPQPEAMPAEPIRGMIPIPAEMQEMSRLRAEAAARQKHYAPSGNMHYLPSSSDLLIDDDEPQTGYKGKLTSRLLLGSLAGLMVMEGFTEREQDSGSATSKRGLFALPGDLLTESRGFREPIRQRILMFLASPHGQAAKPMLKVTGLLLAAFVVYCFYLSMFGISKKTMANERKRNSVIYDHNGVYHPPRSGTTTPTEGEADETARPPDLAVREFIARQAIGAFSLPWWMKGESGADEEAVGTIVVGKGEVERRRWQSYARMLPKLLWGKSGG